MRDEANPQSGVLYYPTIEFLDEAWLKSTLCIWDCVYRIVPDGYSPNDSDGVKEAIDAGAVRNIRLSAEDLRDTANSFTTFCDELAFLPAGLEESDNVEVRLHPEKVEARLISLMESLSRTVDGHGWLHLPAGIATGYMLFLAETVARRRALPKMTDNADVFAIMPFFTTNGGVGELVYDRDAEEVAMALVLGLMAEADKSVGALADQIGGYYMDKVKLKADKEQTELIIAGAKEAFAEARIDTTDGARFDFDDGWLHIRPSNTEPVMRVIVETKTKESAQKYIDTVTKILKEVLG